MLMSKKSIDLCFRGVYIKQRFYKIGVYIKQRLYKIEQNKGVGGICGSWECFIILNRVVRVDFIETVIFKLRLENMKGLVNERQRIIVQKIKRLLDLVKRKLLKVLLREDLREDSF